jgi:predicted component of type VI protein secretion system
MQQSNEPFRLVVRRGPQPNQTYDLNKDIITLGRDITNDIVINDPEVSRHHMRLTRGAGGFTIEDLGSTNGTFINGQRMTGAKPLTNGDMIGLGETVTLGYELVRNIPGMAAPAAPMAQQAPPQPAPQQPVNPYAPPADVAPHAPAQPMQPQPMQAMPQQPTPQPQSSQASSYGYGAQPLQSQYPQANQPAYGQAAPQAPGSYDYDPYAAREDEPRSNLRWIVIGCVVLLLFCCCISVVSLVLVDQACLWDRIPIVWDVLQAFGVRVACVAG